MSRFLICSFALVLLYPAGIDMYLVGLPRIAADLNASEAQLHIAFSVYLAGMAAAMLFAGKVADRSGRKPVAIPGAALFIIASVFCSLAETSTLFLAGRFLQGLGAGCCYVVAFAILRDTLDDRRRAKVLSLLNGITCIIPVLAPVLGHLIMLKFPWQSLFWAMAMMGIAVLMLSLFMLNLQSKCNKKRSTHQLEYNFVSTQKPFPNDEYFLPTSYNKRARKDNDFTRTGQKTSRNCQSTGT